MWIIIVFICIAGAIGGLVNALMSDNGFALPRPVIVKDGTVEISVWQPGILGNVLIGIVAAFVSWGLYGPLASYVILPTSPTTQAQPTLTLAAFVGAILVGIGGSRWLSNEVDKTLLQKAAAKAAGSASEPTKATQMASATPAQAFSLAFDSQ